jgi:hypothetical protein
VHAVYADNSVTAQTDVNAVSGDRVLQKEASPAGLIKVSRECAHVSWELSLLYLLELGGSEQKGSRS